MSGGFRWTPPLKRRAQLRRLEEDLRLLRDLAHTRPLRGVEVWYATEVRRQWVRLREQGASRPPTGASVG